MQAREAIIGQMKNNFSRRVFLVGGAHTKFIGKGHPDFVHKKHPDFGKKTNPTFTEHLSEAISKTLAPHDVPPGWIDRGFVSNFAGELFVDQGHMGAALAGYHPGLANKPMMRVEGACASGGLAIQSAVDAIRAGSDMVLAAGVEVQTTKSARDGAAYLARAADYARQHKEGEFTFPWLFARRMQAYQKKFGVSSEDVARASVKAYRNANKNPLAHCHAVKMTLENASAASDSNPTFLNDPEMHPFIKMSDCSQVSDGASAALFVSGEGLLKMGLNESDAIELLHQETSVSSLYEDSANLFKMSTVKDAAAKAYFASGISANDVQVAEVHDCFSVAELMMYEALGFCPSGKAASMLKDGVTDIDGRLPVNTGGGLVGFGHPVGATGIKQAVEIFRQMKGMCGDYQMSKLPGIGLAANMGGDDKTACVSIYKNL